ncbi:MAG TPA: ABC transporter ATP-binding protein [Thermoplasmata archaeon]|nr:ABC transporter ATP-binding protein [Thermoplasmata archaeon]
MSSPRLEVDRLCVRWGRQEVVHAVSFSVNAGELLTLLGPNGSGKTTLLRAIAGFERPASGTVRVDGHDLAGVPPHRRSIGMLFQDPALFPHRSVFENIAYAPMVQRRPDRETREVVGRLSTLLSLEHLLDRSPVQLSGGERQRVALARTLAARPLLVLLDEPFASVDVEIRAGLHAEFRAALREFGSTAVHVTHDREEGLFLGDRVALIFDGSLDAVGPPREVHEHPRSERAARFLGYNVMQGSGGRVAVLPEDLTPTAPGSGRPTYSVRATGRVGRQCLAVLAGPSGERVEVRSEAPLAVGAVVGLTWSRSVALPEEPPRLDGGSSVAS